MLTDTHPEAERVQIELHRRKSPAERFMMVRSMTAFTLGLSREALRRLYPDLSPEQFRLKIIEHHYGKELAQAVRDYLSQ
ncbi:MAG: hypothetical protein JXB10_06820 [Pirellulales bacterium]|nr:hypothetical protein [Pirellulales bacterium]